MRKCYWLTSACEAINQHDPTHSVSPSTLDDGALQLARRWLESCCRGHPKCASFTTSHKLSPVQTCPDCTSRIHLKQSTHCGDNRDHRRRALHYLESSLGQAIIPTCDYGNTSSMKRGFEATALPAAFRDAFHVTRALGYTSKDFHIPLAGDEVSFPCGPYDPETQKHSFIFVCQPR